MGPQKEMGMCSMSKIDDTIKQLAVEVEIGAMLICGSPVTNIDGMKATAKILVDKAAEIQILIDRKEK